MRSGNFDMVDLKPQELVLHHRNVKCIFSNKQVMRTRDNPNPYHFPIPLHLHLSPTTATKMMMQSVFDDTKRGPLYIITGEKQIPDSMNHMSPFC